jgi:indole-3-glycerol phosphate synthase
MSFLEDILDVKRREVAAAKALRPLAELKDRIKDVPPSRPFESALRGKGISIIAEIKKASPSRGIINHNFDHCRLAQEFETAGAKALSVLTDQKFFEGQPKFISDVKRVSGLPVLRKDFIVDEYQVYESKWLDSDAILLIVRILEEKMLKRLYDSARSLGLAVLVEVHTSSEIRRANTLGADIIGINNRDLDTFEVSLDQSLNLRKEIHTGALTVSESGIRNAEDVERLRNAGFNAVLIGEGLAILGDRIQGLKRMAHYG